MPKTENIEASLVALFTVNHEVMATVEVMGEVGIYEIKGIKFLIEDKAPKHDTTALQAILEAMQAGIIDELPEMNREHTTGQGSLF